MAKLPRGAKSQAIRDYLTVTPGAMPKDVIAALRANGITVTGQMVSTLKAKMVGGGKKRGRKKGSVARTNGQMISIETLIKAKKMIETLAKLQ